MNEQTETRTGVHGLMNRTPAALLRAEKALFKFFSLMLIASAANAGVVYEQPPSASGGLYRSCWWDPDGSDYDQAVWEGFTLASTQAIAEVRWRGGFDPAYFGSGGPVVGFTIEFWSSIVGGSQPDIGSYFTPNPLRHHVLNGNANQTPAGTFGGVAMYDYRYTLPTSFVAAAGVKYWVLIKAWQHGIPDWGLSVASSGDGAYFREIAGMADKFYQIVPGNAAFSLHVLNALPGTPIGLVASGGNGYIDLTWSASVNATSYNVKRSTNGVVYAFIGNSTTTNFTDTTVAYHTLYYYKVSALNDTTEGSNSTAVTATTILPPTANTDDIWQVAGTSLKIPIAQLLANDYDMDGDPVFFDTTSPTTANGLPLSNDTTFVYVPTNSLDDTFIYTIVDDHADIAAGFAQIWIWPSTDGEVRDCSPGSVTFWGVPNYQYEIQRATNITFTGALRLWTHDAPIDGLMQINDDFTDLGSSPGQAFYRMRYKP